MLAVILQMGVSVSIMIDGKSTIDFYKGHIKDVGLTEEIEAPQGFYPASKAFFQKTERLTTAIYILTDFFDRQEPIKWKLRTKSLFLFSLITSASDSYMTSNNVMYLSRAISEISKICDLITLASCAHLISSMNTSILKGEFLELGGSIRTEIENGEIMSDFNFPDNFFSHDDGGEESTRGARLADSLKQSGQRVYKRHDGSASMPDGSPYRKKKNAQKQSSSVNERTRPYVDGRNNAGDTLEQERVKNSRRALIVRFLKTKGEIAIKDILSVISGCSEKTIQRELVSLINEGVVRKVGERRWSKYVLA